MRVEDTPCPKLIAAFESERVNLVRFAKTLGASDPEDAVQDAVIYALEKSYDKRYDETGPLSPVAYARLMVYWRVRAQQAEAVRNDVLNADEFDEDSDDVPTTDHTQTEVVIDVQNALAELPLHEKIIAQGVLMHNETLDHMALITGKSKGWVFNTLESAKAKLVVSLGVYAGRNTTKNKSDYSRLESCSSSRRA